MKESYFTKETIDDKSSEMLKRLRKFSDRSNFRFIPEKSALVILDAQRYFFDKNSHAFIPGSTAIIPKIKSLMNIYHEMSLPIIMTQHINNDRNANMLAIWWGDLITEKDSMCEIIPDLYHKEATIIRKTQYDAFFQTHLESFLKEKGVTQVVVTGVMTHLCCETTARSAFVRGFFVFFPVDGTATYNDEFHWGTLYNLSHGFAVPVLCNELENEMRDSINGNL